MNETDKNLASKKAIANYTKQIEGIQYLIKIDQQNFNDEKEKHIKEMANITKQIDYLNNSLENAINELNIKEKEIYEIQHRNITEVFANLEKIDKVRNEMKERIKLKEEAIETITNEDDVLYNRNSIVEEDIIAMNGKINSFNKEIEKLNNKIEDIKSTYTKEFKFLCEDFVSEKKTCEIKQKISHLQKLINELENKKIELITEKQQKSTECINKQSDFDLLCENISFAISKDQSVEVLEKEIQQNIFDIVNINNYRDILISYFSNKNYYIENKIDINTLQIISKGFNSLFEKLSEELKQLTNEIEVNGLKIQNIKTSRKTKRYQKENEAIQKKFKTDTHNSYVLQQVLQCLLKITNKYDSYLPKAYSKENKVSIIAFDFEQSLYSDIISLIVIGIKENVNEVNMKTQLQLYCTKLCDRYIKKNELNQKKQEEESKLNIVKQSLATLGKEIEDTGNAIVKSKKELNQCKSEYDILMDEMSNRAKTIKNILSLISVEQFEKYLKLNESLYKGIIKSGIKIKNNELSITKEEFIEHVIIDHSIKKREINEIIEEINSYQEKINLYNKSLQELEKQYPSISDEYKKNVDKLNTVIKEKIMLEDSCKEIEKTIQDNLERIEKETLQEKELLQTENNIPFYKQQIVYINEKIVTLEKEKKRLEENYISNEKNYITKNEKNQTELNILQTKLNTLAIKTGNDIMNIIPTSVAKTIESNEESKVNEDIISSEEIAIKKIVPLVKSGVFLYKKAGNSSSVTITDDFKPEKNGYVLRNFFFDPIHQNLLIKNNKLNQIEKRLNIRELSKIMMNQRSKDIIQKEKAKEHSILEKGKLIHFLLLIKEGNLDLISTNYVSYQLFSDAIEEILKNRKNLQFFSKLNKY